MNLLKALLAFTFLFSTADAKETLRISKALQKMDVLREEFRAVGRLVVDEGSPYHCTATLIAAQTVVTARHCLYHDDGRRVMSAVFQPGYPHLDQRFYVKAMPIAEEGNLALLRLERASEIKPLPLHFARVGDTLKFKPEEVMLLGYNESIDAGHALSFDRNCSAVDGNPIFTSCLMDDGGSGGPFVMKRKVKGVEQWMLVALAESAPPWKPDPWASIENLNQLTPIKKARELIQRNSL